MTRQRARCLFKKYFDKTISSAEREELMQYIGIASSQEINWLMEEVYTAQADGGGEEFFTAEQTDKVLDSILSAINEETRQPESMSRAHGSKKQRIALWAVAAVLVLSTTFGMLFYKNYADSMETLGDNESIVLDILPGGDRATLTLADGSVISLNELTDGKIAEESGVVITKNDNGQLVYTVVNPPIEQWSQGDEFPSIAYGYNTISTPRGGQYQVILPDGTQVWLNAESSLRYPTMFSKNERQVELTGEGYFEVAKDEHAPFLVSTDEQTIRVIGTHFNINAYQQKQKTETTLLEGSVEVKSRIGKAKTLVPGEQAIVSSGSAIAVKKVDASNAIAWKQGFFYFDGTPIERVMEELSRWYNFDFENKAPQINLWGRIYRNVNASEALDILSYFNLKYRVVGMPERGGKWKVVVSQM